MTRTDSFNAFSRNHTPIDLNKPLVAFAHLGCEKNRVDTEHMLGLLAEAGYGVSSDTESAAVVVVNTCSFIQDAREESVRTLVGLADQGKELIIAGCLAQQFREELLELLPEAKAVLKKHYQLKSIDGLGISEFQLALRASGGLLSYLNETNPIIKIESKQKIISI